MYAAKNAKTFVLRADTKAGLELILRALQNPGPAGKTNG
jgi:hypothetical protein